MKLKQYVLVAASIGAIFSTTVLFQNCGAGKYSGASDMLSTLDVVTTTFVRTTMNTPVTFIANHDRSYQNVHLSFQTDTPEKGTFTETDAAQVKITYQPAFGFRGRQEAKVFVNDSYGNKQELNVVVDVDNSLSSLEPALAIRGVGCIQCHANVAANVVTDFGYGGNGKTLDYTFGTAPAASWWNSGSPYGDHGGELKTLNMSTSKTIFVPKDAQLPQVVKSATGLNTIAQYVRERLSVSAYPASKLSSVQEKNNVYIGAPSAVQILDTFKFTASQRWKFYRNDNDAEQLSGLKDEGTFFRNNGTLVCDGDLALKGPLYFENLKIKSNAGCRIYVMGSVFIFGSISFVDSGDKHNLQITSSKAIAMGLGKVKNNGVYCEPGSNYAVYPTNADYVAGSTMNTRFVDMWTTPSSFVRKSNDPKAYGRTVLADVDIVQAKMPAFLDASCRPEGRTVSYERLLLNAPLIHSRYNGNVKGTMIAEYALMSLGAFKFEFDPIFHEVPVLPFLNREAYLEVE